ncbi:MAG TPA: hypothetical protein VMD30_00705, partial [Tepidisphaeraceae bacterium]|nr:hypothetical protein [Tepidisphaeraceae bacterium]
MHNQIRIVAAAALALGSFTLVARGADNSSLNGNSNSSANINDNNAANPNATANNPQGQQVSDADAQAIRNRIADTTSGAFSSDPISSISQNLTQSDQQRLQNGNSDNSDLSQLSDAIKSDFQNKYNKSLTDVGQEQVALDDVQVYQGNFSLGNGAQSASEKMYPSNQTPQMRGNVNPNAG